MWRSLFLILFLSSGIYAYKDCGSGEGIVYDVQIAGCDRNVRRCLLKRNTNASMEITFSPKVDTDSLQAVVHGIMVGVPIPFDLPNPDACKDSGISCPLKAGQNYTYVTTIPIKASYPRVTVDIKWELQMTDEKDVVCQEIPAKLV